MPPVLRPEQVIKGLEAVGFRFVSQKGSHRKYKKDGRSVIVPMHYEVAKGTLVSILEQAHDFLYNEISALPIEKVGKAVSFIRYLKQEPELELFVDPDEEKELHELLASGETTDAPDVLAKIRALPDDSI